MTPWLLSDLPAECQEAIFSNLTLPDLLPYAATSTTSLRDLLPELGRHRAALKEDAVAPGLLPPRGDRSVVSTHESRLPGRRLPSVQTSVQTVYRQIPSSHPMVSVLREIKDDLGSPSMDLEHRLDDVATSSRTYAVPDWLHLYRRLLAVPQRLAAIRQSVLPMDCMEADESTVALHRYVGDVLCVTHLGPALRATLAGGLHRNEIAATTPTPYRSWVHWHSRILQTKSFSAVHRKRLGLVVVDDEAPRSYYDVSGHHHHAESYPVTDAFFSSDMTLVFREFGPLGRSFRGRDLVSMHAVSARDLVAYDRGSSSNNEAAEGETARQVLEWMCLVHEQSRTTQPMTVRPPQVRLCVPGS
jgi:hypothetical protein